MVLEDGVNWQPQDPQLRGRHATFSSALEAAYRQLQTEHDPFFDSLATLWPRLFPGVPAKPGRYEDGHIYLYVASAPLLFAVRRQLPQLKRTLARQPGAPRRLDLRLEIRTS